MGNKWNIREFDGFDAEYPLDQAHVVKMSSTMPQKAVAELLQKDSCGSLSSVQKQWQVQTRTTRPNAPQTAKHAADTWVMQTKCSEKRLQEQKMM